MNGTTNRTDTVNIEKRLDEINETLSSISAKEVLFIITLSFLAVFAAMNMCLLILERRKKKKQNSVPQAIVIQPNNTKMDNKPGRNDKSKVSSGYEKDVLPSKSMKMKVAISPSMSVSKKARVPSKESTTEDSQTPKSDVSQTEKTIKKTVPPTTVPPPLENAASADVTTAVEPVAVVPIPALPVASASTTPSSVTPAVAQAPLAGSSAAPTAENSQSNESSMTSFTVPEEATSHRSKIQTPKETTPSTPTATTLSGVSSASTGPSEIIKSIDMTTAKDITQVKSPMTPVRTPEVPAASAPPAVQINTTTPPPNSEKKI